MPLVALAGWIELADKLVCQSAGLRSLRKSNGQAGEPDGRMKLATTRYGLRRISWKVQA